jgi:hypothetical protein
MTGRRKHRLNRPPTGSASSLDPQRWSAVFDGRDCSVGIFPTAPAAANALVGTKRGAA